MARWFFSHAMLIEVSLFVSVSSAAALLAYLYSSWDRRPGRRFRDLFRSEQAQRIDRRLADAKGGLLRKLLLTSSVAELSERLVTDDERSRNRMKSRLSAAGMYDGSSLAVYCLAKLLAMVVPACVGVGLGLLGFVHFRHGLIAGCLLGGIGFLAPGLWLDRRKARRQRHLRRALPDFLDLMVGCLEGGMGFDAALIRVTEELRGTHPLLTGELMIVRREADLGTPLDAALEHFAQRTDSEEIHSVASFYQQAQRFGTGMAEAMRQLADMLRMQREQRAEEMAHKASVKMMLPMLLFIFPAIFVVLAGPAAIKLQEAFSTPPSNKNGPAHRQAPRHGAPAKR